MQFANYESLVLPAMNSRLDSPSTRLRVILVRPSVESQSLTEVPVRKSICVEVEQEAFGQLFFVLEFVSNGRLLNNGKARS
jgi:hypothetical protein